MIAVSFHMEVLSVLKRKLFCNDPENILNANTVA